VSTLRIPYFTFSDCGYKVGENTDFSKPMSKDVPYFQQHCRRSWDSDIIHKNLEPFSGEVGQGQRTFQLEVKTLRTIMAELGHTYVPASPLTRHCCFLCCCLCCCLCWRDQSLACVLPPVLTPTLLDPHRTITPTQVRGYSQAGRGRKRVRVFAERDR